METIRDRWQRVQERVGSAAIRAGRQPDDVEIVAVSKTVPLDRILEARDGGITRFGENRIQEAIQKFGQHRENLPGSAVELHLVGHLQTNKVRKAFDLFDMIHSVDSLHLAEALSRVAGESGRTIPILFEVNTSGEASKFGIAPDQVIELARQAAPLPHIEIRGLMTVGAWLPDPEAVRPCFRLLRELRDRIQAERIPDIGMDELSMGMTNDFEVAIEEGATIVRIGTAIFGPRAD